MVALLSNFVYRPQRIHCLFLPMVSSLHFCIVITKYSKVGCYCDTIYEREGTKD